MSVIVKGMEMPDKCCDCDAEQCDESFYGDELNHFCSFIYNGYTDNIRDRGRLNDCPLRPLPEKHGRLIDADAMKRIWMGARIDGDIGVLLDARPTIVEAEGDD